MLIFGEREKIKNDEIISSFACFLVQTLSIICYQKQLDHC